MREHAHRKPLTIQLLFDEPEHILADAVACELLVDQRRSDVEAHVPSNAGELATYGTCMGAVLASTEVCNNGLDDDCDSTQWECLARLRDVG